MRVTGVILLAACLSASAHVRSQKVSLSEQNATLEKVFTAIEKQSGYAFFYNISLLQNAKPVTVYMENAALIDVLEFIFKEQPFVYSVINKNIVVREKKVTKNPGQSFAQPLSGRVLDANGSPIPGASILVKGGGSGGVVTDNSGRFTIDVNNESVLVVSSVGYLGLSVKITDIEKGNFNAVIVSNERQPAGPGNEGSENMPVSSAISSVRVLPDANAVINLVFTLLPRISLEQAVTVSTGYYSTSRRLSTGSISKITAKEIALQPVGNPLQALQGRMPGVQVFQNNGVPGGALTILIRGRNSLRNNVSDPLYVIDGVPFSPVPMASGNLFGANRTPTVLSNPLNSISIQDIEHIEVLKDADATTIYGSRGANGVVLITTKKGKPGSMKLEADVSAGISTLERRMDLMNTAQYLEMRKEAFSNDGVIPTASNFREYFRWDTTRYTDWQDVLLGNSAGMYNMQLSIAGGSVHTRYRIAGGIRRENTVFPGDNYNSKANLSFSLQHTTDDRRFTAALTANYVADENNLPSTDLTYAALTLPPNAPELYDENGGLNWESSTWTNPLSYLLQKYSLKNKNLVSNITLSYKMLPDLQVKTNMGLNRITTNEFTSMPLSSLRPSSRPAYQATSQFNTASHDTWIVEPQLDYQLKFSGHRLTVLAGTTFQQSIRERMVLTATNFSNEGLMENINAATTVTPNATEHSLYRFASVFGRINYELKEQFLLNLSGRQDWSSRFAPGNKHAIFYSVGAAWLFSNMDFMKPYRQLFSHGKLRVSYGTSGSDLIGDYNYLDTYEPNNASYLGVRGISPTRLLNPGYGWEENRKFEASVELGFWQDKLFFTAAFFNNRTSRQLIGYALPPTTGFINITSNFPATVQNSGWEFQLSADIVNKATFRWQVSANLSLPENKLLAFPGIANTPYDFDYTVGQSLFLRKKYVYAGVDPQTGRYLFEEAATGNKVFSPAQRDRQGKKVVAQTLYGGWQNSIKWGRFNVDFLFQFVKQQGDNYLSYLAYGFNNPGMLGNQPVFVLNRWQKPGDITDIQRFSQSYDEVYDSYSTAQFSSDKTISDASFIRLKNVAVSYELPASFARKVLLKNVVFYAQAQNLLTITNYAGLDPESQLITSLPPLRTIAGGIKITL